MAHVLARMETHYFMHDCFFSSPTQLMDDMPRIAHIPATMVHGRQDMCCPYSVALNLHRVWPSSTLITVEAAGHSGFETGITSALVAATDAYAGL